MVEEAARAVSAIGPIFTQRRGRARAAGPGRSPDVGRAMMDRLREGRRRSDSRNRENWRPFGRSGAIVLLGRRFDSFPDFLGRFLGLIFRRHGLGGIRFVRRGHDLLGRRFRGFLNLDRRLHFGFGLLVGLVHRLVNFRVASARSAADGGQNWHADGFPLLHHDRAFKTAVLKERVPLLNYNINDSSKFLIIIQLKMSEIGHPPIDLEQQIRTIFTSGS